MAGLKKEDAALRIEQLREELQYHNQKYYVEDTPKVMIFLMIQLISGIRDPGITVSGALYP